MRGARTAALVAWIAATGCAPTDDTPLTRASAIAIAGPWDPPSTTRAIAATQRVRVVDPPNVSPLGRCTSTNPFACSCTHPECHSAYPGTVELDAFLRRRFTYLRYGGLFCCRQNSAMTTVPALSVHAIGRAIDLMVPMVGGQADNTLGDAVANFLVEHAEEIGIQRVIWDHTFWNGERGFGLLSASSLPHTDHVHVELSIDGANRRTSFFTAGASTGGTTCTAHCEGTRIVQADCSSGDCAAFGTTCIPGAPPRCGTPECPPTGRATVCVDRSHILTCNNGALTGPPGDCGAFASFCSTAGATPTTARCTFALCVGSPTTAPYDHSGCWLVGGVRLLCRADNTSSQVACPAGQACVDHGDNSSCEPASPACPLQPMGAPVLDRMVCLDATTIARCYNGNQSDIHSCGPSGACRDTGAGAVCITRACFVNNAVVRHPVCIGGYIATCANDATADCVQACPNGFRCEPTQTGVTCVPGLPDPEVIEGVADLGSCGVTVTVPDAGVASSDVPASDVQTGDVPASDVVRTDAAAMPSDGSVVRTDAAMDPTVRFEDAPAGCACTSGRCPSPTPGSVTLSVLALATVARRRRR